MVSDGSGINQRLYMIFVGNVESGREKDSPGRSGLGFWKTAFRARDHFGAETVAKGKDRIPGGVLVVGCCLPSLNCLTLSKA